MKKETRIEMENQFEETQEEILVTDIELAEVVGGLES